MIIRKLPPVITLSQTLSQAAKRVYTPSLSDITIIRDHQEITTCYDLQFCLLRRRVTLSLAKSPMVKSKKNSLHDASENQFVCQISTQKGFSVEPVMLINDQQALFLNDNR